MNVDIFVTILWMTENSLLIYYWRETYIWKVTDIENSFAVFSNSPMIQLNIQKLMNIHKKTFDDIFARQVFENMLYIDRILNIVRVFMSTFFHIKY
jgi:hypothetical protein